MATADMTAYRTFHTLQESISRNTERSNMEFPGSDSVDSDTTFFQPDFSFIGNRILEELIQHYLLLLP